MKKRGLLTGFAIGLMVGLLFVPVVARTAPSTDSIAGLFGLPQEWDKAFFIPLGIAARQIEARYVDEVDPGKVLVGAYQGFLSKLDDYSSYIPPEMLKEFEDDTRGAFGGLGIHIRFFPVEKILRVESPIPGTPAFSAGVLAGDIITKVHEVSTGEEMETSKLEGVHDAVRILRGQPGTKVTITVLHEDTRQEEDITVTRAIIKVPGARAERMVDDRWKIGYVYVAHFHERTVEDLKERIEGLQQQGLRALIVDLRFNSGGLLSSSVNLSDMFLEGGVVVSTRGRNSDGPGHEAVAEEGDILSGAPLVILVNRYSASASEIVAGAIQQNKRGILIGEKTFGKGSVQSIIPVGAELGAIKLTTARYYTPDGVCIEGKGVQPDVEVTLTDLETRRLVRAVSEAIEFPPQPDDDTDPDAEEIAVPNSEEDSGEEEAEPFRDIQLERAVDVLIGMLVQQERRT